MMADHLLDCNHLAAAIRKVSVVRDRIHQSVKTGDRFITIHPVLCELEVGIQQTAKPSEYRRRLAHLLSHVRLWPLDGDSAKRYGEAYHELKSKGRALSQVDLMLAAFARQHKLVVLTTDKDFKAFPDLPVEDWVS